MYNIKIGFRYIFEHLYIIILSTHGTNKNQPTKQTKTKYFKLLKTGVEVLLYRTQPPPKKKLSVHLLTYLFGPIAPVPLVVVAYRPGIFTTTSNSRV